MITLGIDEVGRGPWVGPLAVGAVILDSENAPPGLRDSKKLSPKKREIEAKLVKQTALAIGVAFVDAPILDRIGMTRALHLAAQNAYFELPENLRNRAEKIVIDGTGNFLKEIATSEKIAEKIMVMARADATIPAVSAASIVAKVSRDNYMRRLDAVFPGYNFAKNSGYGTAAHALGLKKFGVIPGVHRASFRPIREMLGVKIAARGTWQISEKLALTSGRRAEEIAAEFLASRSHEIVARNYKTRFYEIDIVSKKGENLFFTEVKFRENDRNGDGLDAITAKKLAQMQRAAEIFLASFRAETSEFSAQLSAIALAGDPPEVTKYVENVRA